MLLADSRSASPLFCALLSSASFPYCLSGLTSRRPNSALSNLYLPSKEPQAIGTGISVASSLCTMAMPHSPAQSWSFRVPSPPRIIVPLPLLNADGMPDLRVIQDPSFDFQSSGFQNVEFLKKVTYGNFMTANNMLEWKYEQRRMAQQILPFLYLGPMAAARDKAFLQREGITMVLVVRNTMSAQAKLLGTKAAEELGLASKMIDVAGNQELIAAFPKAIELINLHLSTMYQRDQARAAEGVSYSEGHQNVTPGKVLIFCETGNERSAALVTAYIMAMYATDLIKAIQIVQAQRFAVAFDDSLRNLLSTYEAILQARRDVIQAKSGHTGPRGGAGFASSATENVNGAGNSSKRSFDAAQGESMDVDEEDEVLDLRRFDGRAGPAPFQDQPSLKHEYTK